MKRIGIFASALLAICATRVAAFPTCTEAGFYFDCSSCSGVTSTEPTGKVMPIYCTVAPWQAGQPCANACYDLPNGRIEAHQAVDGHTRCHNGVGVRDTLRLAGEEGTAPISFEAVYIIHCTTFNGGSGQAALLSPGGGTHRIYSANQDEELVFPLSLVPGDALEIRFGATASNASPCCVSGGLAGADITVDLRFRGLPAGYRMLSCSGITAPVPASAASWGSVKALYR